VRPTAVLLATAAIATCRSAPQPAALERIRVDAAGRGFATATSGRSFHPWGMNYGNASRLMEDFWAHDWATLAGDLHELAALGANVVRVHLQAGRFMLAPDRANPEALVLLTRLLRAAEDNGLYLDVTGLACYRPSDVPAWYDALDEAGRWHAQAAFWEAVAATCAGSPAMFCYDLVNEPFVPAERREVGRWSSGSLFGGFDLIQYVALDPAGRPPSTATARSWPTTTLPSLSRSDSSSAGSTIRPPCRRTNSEPAPKCIPPCVSVGPSPTTTQRRPRTAAASPSRIDSARITDAEGRCRRTASSTARTSSGSALSTLLTTTTSAQSRLTKPGVPRRLVPAPVRIEHDDLDVGPDHRLVVAAAVEDQHVAARIRLPHDLAVVEPREHLEAVVEPRLVLLLLLDRRRVAREVRGRREPLARLQRQVLAVRHPVPDRDRPDLARAAPRRSHAPSATCRSPCVPRSRL
jgi:hypothetical protein